jgi:hypothetical protein
MTNDRALRDSEDHADPIVRWIKIGQAKERLRPDPNRQRHAG